MFANFGGTLINLALVERVEQGYGTTEFFFAGNRSYEIAGRYRDHVIALMGAPSALQRAVETRPALSPDEQEVIAGAANAYEAYLHALDEARARREAPATEPQRSGSPDAWK